jgi:hypothetical protein
VLDERTLARADFRGNRQYVSLGNIGRRRPRRSDPDGLRESATRSRSGVTARSTSSSVKRGVMCCGQFQSKPAMRTRIARSTTAW